MIVVLGLILLPIGTLILILVAIRIAAEQRIKSINRLSSAIRENMTIDVRRRTNLRMPKHVAHNHERHALVEEQRCTAMAQVMEPYSGGQPSSLKHRFELPMQVSWFHERSYAGREDETMLLPVLLPLRLVLPNPVLTKHIQQDGRYRQCSDARLRFGRSALEHPATTPNRASDPQLLLIEIDVFPPQCQHFAPPQAKGKVAPMSSTTFAPVFRVGASVTLMKRLTPVPKNAVGLAHLFSPR